MNSVELYQPEVTLLLQKKKILIARPVDPQPPEDAEMVEFHQGENRGFECLNDKVWWFTAAHGDMWPCSHDEAISSPFGKVGDELYGQEEWGVVDKPGYFKDGDTVYYKIDGQFFTEDLCWYEAVTMSQWASRLPLTLKSLTVKRVQDVTASLLGELGYNREEPFASRLCYRKDWQSRHPKHPWTGNPWGWLAGLEVKDA